MGRVANVVLEFGEEGRRGVRVVVFEGRSSGRRRRGGKSVTRWAFRKSDIHGTLGVGTKSSDAEETQLGESTDMVAIRFADEMEASRPAIHAFPNACSSSPCTTKAIYTKGGIRIP